MALLVKGDNFGYFAPCGYVAPWYYDNNGAGFLKSFTAGFLTTCGLTAVGSPCVDMGEELPCFTQWKMMGEYDYVMGLEPGNCYPDGRDVMREKGMLEFLKPDETKTHTITFKMTEK